MSRETFADKIKKVDLKAFTKDLNDATFGVNENTLADHLKPETIEKVAEYLYNIGYRRKVFIPSDFKYQDTDDITNIFANSNSMVDYAIQSIKHNTARAIFNDIINHSINNPLENNLYINVNDWYGIIKKYTGENK